MLYDCYAAGKHDLLIYIYVFELKISLVLKFKVYIQQKFIIESAVCAYKFDHCLVIIVFVKYC